MTACYRCYMSLALSYQLSMILKLCNDLKVVKALILKLLKALILKFQ